MGARLISHLCYSSCLGVGAARFFGIFMELLMKSPLLHRIACYSICCLAALLLLPSAHATRPLISHMVHGCIAKNRFIPYAGQAYGNEQKVPYWVRHATTQKLEGQELQLNWSSPSASRSEIDNFCTKKRCSVKVHGPCDRSRLVASPSK